MDTQWEIPSSNPSTATIKARDNPEFREAGIQLASGIQALGTQLLQFSKKLKELVPLLEIPQTKQRKAQESPSDKEPQPADMEPTPSPKKKRPYRSYRQRAKKGIIAVQDQQ